MERVEKFEKFEVMSMSPLYRINLRIRFEVSVHLERATMASKREEERESMREVGFFVEGERRFVYTSRIRKSSPPVLQKAKGIIPFRRVAVFPRASVFEDCKKK